jgi:hypothetical protein
MAAASAPLRRAGFSEAQAGFAITSLTTYAIGFTFLAASRSSGPVHRQIQATLRRERPASGEAAAYAVLEQTHRGDADRVFEFGLRHLIAGLATDLPIKENPSTRRREDAKERLRASASSR